MNENEKDDNSHYNSGGYIWWWKSGKSMQAMTSSLSAKLQGKPFEIEYSYEQDGKSLKESFKFKIPKGGIELNA